MDISHIKKFDFNNILYNKYKYSVVKVDTNIFINNESYKLKNLNDKFGTEKTCLDDFKGVYILVLNKDFELTKEFLSCTELYYYNQRNQKYEFAMNCASKFNGNMNQEKTILKKDYVLYCGQSDNLPNRLREHLTNNNYSGTKSLKLGFNEKNAIIEYLSCYVCLIDDKDERSNLEKYIHDTYGCYFGDR